jgi:hypothetical protein
MESVQESIDKLPPHVVMTSLAYCTYKSKINAVKKSSIYSISFKVPVLMRDNEGSAWPSVCYPHSTSVHHIMEWC